ncbi:MAG TPA: hypothetical protein VFN67_07230 [Polyangiales bacterium]|nr:hypothetical protein [Polyangiales bacterium]
MTLQNTDPTLYALFCLRRHTLPVHPGSLARLTGRSASETALDLLKLEDLGLVEADRARLTMLGLTRAARLSRASGDTQQRAQRQGAIVAMRRMLQHMKPPVAAKREPDEADEAPALSA